MYVTSISTGGSRPAAPDEPLDGAILSGSHRFDTGWGGGRTAHEPLDGKDVRIVNPTTTRHIVLPAVSDVARNALALGLLWVAYATVRSITDDTAATAIANAEYLLELQGSIGLDVEAGLQELIGSPAAFVAANAYYLVHFPITLMVLVAAFVRDRNHTYVLLRNSLITVTGVALFVHVAVPLAPPRMLSGFLDTGALYGPDPYSLPGSDGANQFAAMPSMHVAWAMLVGHALWTLNHIRGIRPLAIVHPIVTTAVVLVTAHHFVLDAVIGAALAVVALGVCGWLGTRKRRTAELEATHH